MSVRCPYDFIDYNKIDNDASDETRRQILDSKLIEAKNACTKCNHTGKLAATRGCNEYGPIRGHIPCLCFMNVAREMGYDKRYPPITTEETSEQKENDR